MIPKSLHTITALVNLARYLKDRAGETGRTDAYWINRAADILGYAEDVKDVHGLTHAAVKRMGAK